MTERTQLGEMILAHWREHAPGMVKELERRRRLDRAVIEAQERSGDLLYELLSEKGLEYQQAWELAMREWALIRPEDRPTPSPSKTSNRNRTRRRRGISG